MNIATEPKQGIIARIRWMSAYMNPALRRIAERVLKAPEEIKSISIKDLATQCDVSEVMALTRQVQAFAVNKLTMPVLALGGERGAGAYVLGAMQRLADRAEGGVVARAGHWIADEQPEELARLMRDFLVHEHR